VPAPPPTAELATALAARRGNALELTEEQMAEVNSSLQRGLKKAVSLSLDSYEQAVEIEEAERAALESRLSFENARQEWMAYAEMLESPSLRQAMTSAVLQLEEKTLTATVGLALHRGSLQNELPRLRDTLRQRLHDPELKIHVVLDEIRADESRGAKPQRPLSREERLQVLQENYPLVGDLMQRFGLKLDD
jgi:hypothetical protein